MYSSHGGSGLTMGTFEGMEGMLGLGLGRAKVKVMVGVRVKVTVGVRLRNPLNAVHQ